MSTVKLDLATLQARLSRIRYLIRNPFDSGSPETEASQVARILRQDKADIIDDLNRRADWDSSSDVIKITLTRDDDRATRYVLLDHSGGDISDYSVRNDTAKTVDLTITVDGLATRAVSDDIKWYIDTVARPGRQLSPDVSARICGRYQPDEVRGRLVDKVVTESGIACGA